MTLVVMFLNAAAIFGQTTSPLTSISKIPDEVHARAAQSVVKITAGDNPITGAGLVIGKTRNGLPVILTVNSLIAGHEDKIAVQTEQGRPAPARIISEKWRNRDLVLIAALKPMSVAAALPYGNSDQIAAGEEVAVLGFPQSNFLGQNSGQVVRNEGTQILLNFVLSRGQTGGPVLNQAGHVIGLATSRPQEMVQVIPIDLARAALAQWLGNAQLYESWEEGKNPPKWQGWLLGIGLLLATGVAVGLSGVF